MLILFWQNWLTGVNASGPPMGLVTLLFCQKSNSFSSLMCYCLAIPHEIVPLVQLIIDKLLQKNLKVNKWVVFKIEKWKRIIWVPSERRNTAVRHMYVWWSKCSELPREIIFSSLMQHYSAKEDLRLLKRRNIPLLRDTKLSQMFFDLLYPPEKTKWFEIFLTKGKTTTLKVNF